MKKSEKIANKAEEEVLEKLEPRVRERNVNCSYFSTLRIPVRENVEKLEQEECRYDSENKQIRSDQENATQMDHTINLWETEDSASFSSERFTISNHLSELIQSFCCKIKRVVMFDPVKSSSAQPLERIANEMWSAIEECKDGNTIIDVESKPDEVELGLLNREQLMNLCEQRDLHWVILIDLGSDKICCYISADEMADEKSEFLVELSHPNLEKPFAYCQDDRRLLCVHCFMQKGNLEKHLFRRYPTIEPVSWDKQSKTHIRATGKLPTLDNLKKLDIYQIFKASNILPNRSIRRFVVQTPTSMQEVNAMDTGGFTALKIPSASLQCGKIDVEIKKTLTRVCALRAKDAVEKALRWWHNLSHRQNTQTIEKKYESLRNFRHLLLLTSTLLAMITLHAALKISGCQLEEGYNYNSWLNSIFQSKTYSYQLFIRLNSIVFFSSVALVMRLSNELPLRPWLLASVFSMIGVYMCTIMDLVKPHTCST